MMRCRLFIIGIVGLFILSSGCTMETRSVQLRPGESSYRERLGILPEVEMLSVQLSPLEYGSKIPLKAAIYIDKTIKDKRYRVPLVMKAAIVPFGKIAYRYTNSYLKEGFMSFDEIDTLPSNLPFDLLIKIINIDYHQYFRCDVFGTIVQDCRVYPQCYITITFSIENPDGKQVLNREYTEHCFGGISLSSSDLLSAFKASLTEDPAVLARPINFLMIGVLEKFTDDIQLNYRNWGFVEKK